MTRSTSGSAHREPVIAGPELADFAAALDLAPVMVRDLDGRIRYWSAGTTELYGFAPEEAIGHVSHDLLQTRFPGKLTDIQALLLDQGSWRGELRHCRKNGDEVVVASHWKLLRNDRGAPPGVVEMNTDVTEIRRVQMDRLRLAAVVESSDDAIISSDLDGIVTSWNHGAERMFGYEASDIIGRPLSLLAPPGLEHEIPRILRRIRRGDVVDHHETRRRRKDGTTLDVSLTVSAMRDGAGAIVGASKIARDVTERNRAEAALRESQDHFRALLDNAPLSMWVIDEDGRVHFTNAAWRRYTGQTEAGSEWADALHPDDRASYLDVRSRSIAAGQPYGGEVRFRRTDGAYRWHVTSVAPLRQGDRARSWVGAAHDVDDMRRHAAVLEERVAERTRRLAEANTELESFAYSVAHDLRAPLRGMRGFAQALLEDYAENLDELGRDYARRIVDAAKRLDELINDLLSYARLAREEIRPEPVRLAEILQDVQDKLSDAQGGRAPVQHETLDGLTVLAQRSILHQVFQNLIGNAQKFVAEGMRPDISVTAERSEGRIRVSVQDNGIGFEAKHADRVFGVFERLHAPGSRYPGTGIGLAIVKKGVERLGGRVGAFSEPGRGSRFWFELPAADGENGGD